MLQRKLRLRHNTGFKAIFDKGKSYPGKYVVVYILKGPTKFGFVASKKVGNAVSRNRAKRLMREVIRRNLFFLKEDVQIICIARPIIKGVSYSEVENSIISSFKKAKVM
ncbi:MAG: ribonuclease P protein component [Desulfitobacterium hafniense]|nr:ribonuclease P protein component [Desulfitobacterium hafniense]